jgi:hypothetical protein
MLVLSGLEGKKPVSRNRQNIALMESVQRANFGREWTILMSVLGVWSG